jgi:hypothetical protein
LRVISCWTHGPSARYAARLGEHFPGVEVQGKGLVATEAFVSLPLAPDSEPVLAVRSHFLEFIDAGDGAVRMAHELRPGQVCRVLVSTSGGLYRYDLGDLVMVTGFLGATPCVRFIGRAGLVSDRCGEKLHGAVAGPAAEALLARLAPAAGFFLLAPVESRGRPAYALFVEGGIPDAPALATALDSALRDNFHYDHCRRLGQLGPPGIFLIAPGPPGGAAIFQAVLEARGQRAGEIKMSPLDRDTGWESRFPGTWLVAP